MPVQVVATASPHCAHRRYPQASLALVRGAREAARGKEGSPPLPVQGTLRAGLPACCPQGSVCTRDKIHSLVKGCRRAGDASCTLARRGPRWGLAQSDHTAPGCRKRQLLVIIDGRQQPEGRRMHTPVGDIMAQSHLFQNRNLWGFPFSFCLFSKTSSIPRALPS